MVRKYNKISRRSALRSIGVTAGTVGFGSINAAAKGGKNEFVGVAYDPVTRDLKGEVRANINRTPGKLTGSIKLPKKAIDGPNAVPLAFANPSSTEKLSQQTAKPQIDKQVHNYKGKKDSKKFKKNGRPVDLQITSIEGWDVSGMVKRRGSPSENVAFIIGEVTQEESSGEVITRLEEQISPSMEVVVK